MSYADVDASGNKRENLIQRMRGMCNVKVETNEWLFERLYYAHTSVSTRYVTDDQNTAALHVCEYTV